MKLTKEQVEKIALLSRLELDKNDVKKFQKELSQILDYVEQLQAVNTHHVPTTNQVTGLTNVTRRDKVTHQHNRAEFLASAPEVEDHQVKVKKVL